MSSRATDRRSFARATILAVVLLLATAASGGSSASRVRVAPDLEVVEVVVGHVDQRSGRVVESNRIDTSKHPGFGWRVRFEGARRTVRFREAFILPAPAKTWQVGNETTVSADRSSAVTEGERRLGSELELRNAWIHTDGDPKGKHTMKIWVEGVLVDEVDFVLQ